MRFKSPLLGGLNVLTGIGLFLLLGGILIACARPVLAQEELPKTLLTIHSATDLSAIQPLISAFQANNPQIEVRYSEFQSRSLYSSLTDSGDPAQPVPSLVISSAMDLQTQLVNDGLALPLELSGSRGPAWATWRNEVWGFTFEPIVMVFNRRALQGVDVPLRREDLLQVMRDRPELFAQRIGTYDIAISGAGYLFASQDALRSSLHGRLLEAFGRAQARTYCCSNEILDALSTGELTMGYNLIGSYALKRAQQDPNLVVVLPKDYTLVMSRLAFVPENAPSPDAARAFVNFLLSDSGQQLIARRSGLIALNGQSEEQMTEAWVRKQHQTVYQPIEVGPSLLLYLDQSKRKRFLNQWRSALSGQSALLP